MSVNAHKAIYIIGQRKAFCMQRISDQNSLWCFKASKSSSTLGVLHIRWWSDTAHVSTASPILPQIMPNFSNRSRFYLTLFICLLINLFLCFCFCFLHLVSLLQWHFCSFPYCRQNERINLQFVGLLHKYITWTN